MSYYYKIHIIGILLQLQLGSNLGRSSAATGTASSSRIGRTLRAGVRAPGVQSVHIGPARRAGRWVQASVRGVQPETGADACGCVVLRSS